MFRHPENDNACDPNEPDFDHSWDAPWAIDLLLWQAGFDPALIPPSRRECAFEVASLWQNGIFDRREIEESLGHSERDIRIAVKCLRKAAGARTRVR